MMANTKLLSGVAPWAFVITWALACAVAPRASAIDEQAALTSVFGRPIAGGLIVHVKCGHGQLTTQLANRSNRLVLGLDTDIDLVRQTVNRAIERKLQGRVVAEVFDGKTLPLIDDVANLVIAEQLGGLPLEEVKRVLAPGAWAYVDGRWINKPRPASIDEWTHYMHDPSNNAVAKDEHIAPLRHLQWQTGPRWSRHHDHMASMSAMVTSAGRVFYILDEGSRVSPQLPPSWSLIARDAFNGALLWKKPIDRWFEALWPLKSGPANLPRRLVADHDSVYVTLSIDGPVSALDPATGAEQRVYDGTEGAEEILCDDGMLIVLVNRTPFDPVADLTQDPEEGQSRDRRTTYSEKMKLIWASVRSPRWANADRMVMAIDAASGDVLWSHRSRVLPLTLAADGQRVYFHDGERIVALHRTSGEEAWKSEPVPVWKGLQGQGLQSWFAPTLVVQKGTVFFAGGEKMHMSYMGWGSPDMGEDTMTALDARAGRKLWTGPHPYSGYNSPEDLFVIGDKVWTGRTAKGGADGRFFAHDINTGELLSEFPPTVDTHWFHHRCYRAKATNRFILSSRNGIEFIDLATGQWTIHHWVRGGCLYGILPANGLIYAPPHPCACYPEAKLNGFVALRSASQAHERAIAGDGNRTEHGPAYGDDQPAPSPRAEGTSDWPMYRHDRARSGATKTNPPSDLQTSWQTQLGGKLTQAVIGGGRAFVADRDGGLVHGIDAATGRVLWSFAAGGPVDSSPTYCRGRVLFGSHDGHVYCLRGKDGELVWRFRAAPADLRMVTFDRVESVWPVSGSVLVDGEVATFVAGRSMFLDGGLRVCRVDVGTGRLLGEVVLDDRETSTGESLQSHIKGLNMPVALPDILSSDGNHLFMRSQVLDLEGRRVSLGPEASGHQHLFAPYGFTDDSWFHRTYWIFGDRFSGGVGGFGNGKSNPAGRILVTGESAIFGYGRKPQYYRWGSAIDYHLFAVSNPDGDVSADRRRGKANRRSSISFQWTCDVPMMVRAMALADNQLVIAGPPDVLDEDGAFQSYGTEATQEQLLAQEAAMRGERGGLLRVIDAESGETLQERSLEQPPVFDGVSVAEGRIFVVLLDGRLVCLGR